MAAGAADAARHAPRSVAAVSRAAAARRRHVPRRGGAANRPLGPQRRGEDVVAATARRRDRARWRRGGLCAWGDGRALAAGRAPGPRRPRARGRRHRAARRDGRRVGLAARAGRRADARANDARWSRCLRGALGGDETPRVARAGGRRAARPPLARRAHEPPRHRGGGVARSVSRPLAGNAHVRHPRPHVSPAHGRPDSRDRPGPDLRLVVRLRHVSRAEGGGPRRGRKTKCPLRQEARAGRSLDSHGHQGPPHAERGPRAGLGGAAPGAQRAAGCGRPREARDPGGRSQRGPRGGARRSDVSARPAGDHSRSFHGRDAGRSDRHHRPQRLGQDHAAQADAR